MELNAQAVAEATTIGHSGGPVEARLFDRVAGEDFEIRSVDVQNRIAPNTDLPVTVTFGSDAPGNVNEFSYNNSHPDGCSPGLVARAGANLGIRASVGDSSGEVSSECYNVIDRGDRVRTAVMISPFDPGQHDVSVELIGGSTGTVYDSRTVQLTVEPEDQAPEDPTVPESDDDRLLSVGAIAAVILAAILIILLLTM